MTPQRPRTFAEVPAAPGLRRAGRRVRGGECAAGSRPRPRTRPRSPTPDPRRPTRLAPEPDPRRPTRLAPDPRRPASDPGPQTPTRLAPTPDPGWPTHPVLSPRPRRPPPPTPGLAGPRRLTRSARPPAPPAARPTPRNSSSDCRPGPCWGAGKGASAWGRPRRPSRRLALPGSAGPRTGRPEGSLGREPCPEGWGWASGVLRGVWPPSVRSRRGHAEACGTGRHPGGVQGGRGSAAVVGPRFPGPCMCWRPPGHLQGWGERKPFQIRAVVLCPPQLCTGASDGAHRGSPQVPQGSAVTPFRGE